MSFTLTREQFEDEMFSMMVYNLSYVEFIHSQLAYLQALALNLPIDILTKQGEMQIHENYVKKMKIIAAKYGLDADVNNVSDIIQSAFKNQTK